MLKKNSKKIVVLGTGGTIAGRAAISGDNIGYTAAQVGVGQLLAAIPALDGLPCTVICEQVAQLDSKDMGFDVWQALAVQKVHPYRLDAFNSGDAGPLGFIEENSVRLVPNSHFSHVSIDKFASINIASVKSWPRVEIVMNHTGASGDMVDALLLQAQAGHADPVRGIVVAATGNGTVHKALQAALLRAQAAGVKVMLASRCAEGRVLPVPHGLWPDSQGLSPVKARIALMLSLLDRS